MLKNGARLIIILFFLFSLGRCIDPYTPKLEGYGSLLVVDGLITDENAAYKVRLSRTLQDQNGIPTMVSDATVYITDDAGTKSYLKSIGNGLYKTDSTEFRGVVGRKYVLNIVTEDGEKYESNICLMSDVPEIDSIYFEKDQEVVSNGTGTNEGIRIYLDSKEGDINRYYRWEFEETWEFKVPMPKRSNYIDEKTIIMNPDVREYCWKRRKSDEILIQSVYSGEPGRIQRAPIFFIASDKSDRLMLQYSILVKQYSVSKSEFDFWDNLKKINDKSGDIFEYQPYPVNSNIHNINNPKERILGYFQVSAVKQKRKNILYTDIVGLDLPPFHYSCERIEFSPMDFPWNLFNPPLTWDDVNYMFVTSGYYFVEPKYLQGTRTIDRLVFTKPECADCSFTGTTTKPDFLVDLK
jgi:hypothetical protein